MYFPYLRGKQFELLALRELADLLGEKRDKVLPIVEPVKHSPSALRSAFAALDREGVKFGLIMNPSVGALKKDPRLAVDLAARSLEGFTNYCLTFLIDSQNFSSLGQTLDAMDYEKIRPSECVLIHNEMTDLAAEETEHIESFGPVVYNIVNFKRTSRRYFRSFPEETRVVLDDYFIGLEKNSAYVDQEDSQFSEDHLFYRSEGFVGFSDFLTIGETFSEGGFLPYAVAIHISYVDSKGGIRVKHFVSHSNDDTTDVAGKFAEANSKLCNWVRGYDRPTRALRTFVELNERQHFPGLGTIKKLMVMNHIELVLSLI
ncbi:MAG: sce7725 family protein [Pyrinomonadaceae bacterium]